MIRGVEGWAKMGALESFEAPAFGVKVPLTSWPFAWTVTA